jgi:hypothetical protein
VASASSYLILPGQAACPVSTKPGTVLRAVPLTTCLDRDIRRHPDRRVGAVTITALARRYVVFADRGVRRR